MLAERAWVEERGTLRPYMVWELLDEVYRLHHIEYQVRQALRVLRRGPNFCPAATSILQAGFDVNVDMKVKGRFGGSYAEYRIPPELLEGDGPVHYAYGTHEDNPQRRER